MQTSLKYFLTKKKNPTSRSKFITPHALLDLRVCVCVCAQTGVLIFGGTLMTLGIDFSVFGGYSFVLSLSIRFFIRIVVCIRAVCRGSWELNSGIDFLELLFC